MFLLDCMCRAQEMLIYTNQLHLDFIIDCPYNRRQRFVFMLSVRVLLMCGGPSPTTVQLFLGLTVHTSGWRRLCLLPVPNQLFVGPFVLFCLEQINKEIEPLYSLTK